FLPLTPVVFDILVTLAARDCHGYSILTDIRARTGEALRPGSLYRALNRLLEDRLIAELDERPDPSIDDERRRYYPLTPPGRRIVGVSMDAVVAGIAERVGAGRQGFQPSVSGGVVMRGWVWDMQSAWRSLRARPVFAVTVVGTLALGLGAATAMFAVVNAVLL